MTQPNTPSPDEGKPAIDPIDDEQQVAAENQPNPTPEPSSDELKAEKARLEAELAKSKQDYGASTREAQLLVEKIKQKDAQIEQLTKPHDPTDAELMAAYPDWDSMMPSEQRLARELMIERRARAGLQQTTAEIQAEVRWAKDVKKLVKQPEFSGLKDRLDEFEEYVFTPRHKGIALDVLAKSFLFGSTPPPTPAPAAPAAPTAERGTPNANPPATKKKLTAAEGAALRKNNFEEWRTQVKLGNIETDIE